MSKGYKANFQEVSKENHIKDEEISNLNKKLLELQEKLTKQTSSYGEEKTSREAEMLEQKETLTNLKKEYDSVTEKNTELSEQLRNKELGRFASAYDIQEKEYKTQQDLWFRLSLWATVLLTVCILISIVGSLDPSKSWYREPAFYMLDIIFLTLFVYALKQHSHLGNLRIDYANRKTLVQSYQYIIEDEPEDSEVRKKFLERASNIFSSEVTLKSNDVTIYEALVAKILGKVG